MNVRTSIYALIAILWPTAILTDTKIFSDVWICGPLKVTPSEYEPCYNSESDAEIPCPDKSQPGTRILKQCRPPYDVDTENKQILNVTYQCIGKIWGPSYNACRPECGPLKLRLSAYDACYDDKSGAEIPCPETSRADTTIRKRCRPPYAIGDKNEKILNVTYTCGLFGWSPRYDPCQTDCGRSTEKNKYPWLAAIYDVNEELKCSGTIISEYHVLAAIACFHKPGYEMSELQAAVSNLTIVAGKHYSNIHRKKESAQIRKLKKAIFPFNQVNFTARAFVLLEVDTGFDFLDYVQPACIDWHGYYDQRDFSEGNEAVAIDWDYNKAEVLPCEDGNEFNVQYWHVNTCRQNVDKQLWQEYLTNYDFCTTYLKGNKSNCGKSIGAGLYFKSSPWRYYLRGITNRIITEPEVTYIFYFSMTTILNTLVEQMLLHPLYIAGFGSQFNTRDELFSKTKTGCILPEHIIYGRFKLSFGEAYRPGAWVATRTRILLACTVTSVETPSFTRCNLGEWQPPINTLKCKRPGTCSTLPSSASEDVFCRLNGEEVSCVEPVNNTTAIIRCKPFYAISANKPIYKCNDGLWDQPLARCTLECGTKRVAVSALIDKDSEVIKNEYPWIVAVYRLTEQICGGTIISKSYVLSAAHCFTELNGTARDKELYTIFAGKHYRNISAEEPSVQSRKIKFLHIHHDYKGNLQKYRDDIALIELDRELIPSLEVQPACLDWDNVYEDFDFIDGNKALVVGWGYTHESGSPSDVLKKLILSYRTKDVCIANLPEDFGEQYVVADKICVGHKEKNVNVCKGDSGGGLYFRSDDIRYYVRGIVSLTTETETKTCHLNKFALYTKVSKYLPWIESITRRVL